MELTVPVTKDVTRSNNEIVKTGDKVNTTDPKDIKVSPTKVSLDGTSSVTAQGPNDRKYAMSPPPRIFNYKVQVLEDEEVILKFRPVDTKDIPYKVTWTFNNKPIDQYPKLFFPNLRQETQENGEITLQFSNSSRANHQGTFKIAAISKCWSTEVIFEVTIDAKNKFTKEFENKNTSNKTSDEKPKTTLHRGLHESATFHESRNKLIITSPSSEASGKEENIPKKTNISRVTSMKEMFEKKPNEDNTGNNRDIKRKIGVQNSSWKDHDRRIEEHPTDQGGVASIDHPRTTVVTSNNLMVPNTQTRKLSQGAPASEQSVAPYRRKSSVKDMLVMWSRLQTEQYKNVNITNYSSSWADGLAFCALIHHFYPNSFDYSKLKSTDRRHNFNLAFDTARDLGGIDPLLDTEDMMIMDNPDWKCVYTYVQLMFTKLRDHPRNLLKKPEEEH